MGLGKNRSGYGEVYLMRKIIFLLGMLSLSVLFLLSSCKSADFSVSWKEITIESYGSIRVPKDWKKVVKNGFTSFVVDDEKEVLIEYRDRLDVNPYFDNIEEMIWVRDKWFSNSAGITSYEIRYQDGSTATGVCLIFSVLDTEGFFDSIEFLCLNDTVSYDVLEKIAKSYSME